MTSFFRASLIATALVACTNASPTPYAPGVDQPEPTSQSPAERGKYLVMVAGCNDCHTPLQMTPNGPAPDMSRMLSGHPAQMQLPPAPAAQGPWLASVAGTNTAWAGPWGVSFTANLTPDKETGLGAWTQKTFVDAIRNQRHMGTGRPILPPMPAAGYAQMTTEDLQAIFAYLQTIPAISNAVPAPLAPPQQHAKL